MIRMRGYFTNLPFGQPAELRTKEISSAFESLYYRLGQGTLTEVEDTALLASKISWFAL
jgi:hypothetical protein